MFLSHIQRSSKFLILGYCLSSSLEFSSLLQNDKIDVLWKFYHFPCSLVFVRKRFLCGNGKLWVDFSLLGRNKLSRPPHSRRSVVANLIVSSPID